MTYTLSYYDYFDYTHQKMDSMKDIENIVTASTQDISKLGAEDTLSFMDTFNFPGLDSIKLSLTKSGQYTLEQIEEILSGLKTLPEYNRA